MEDMGRPDAVAVVGPDLAEVVITERMGVVGFPLAMPSLAIALRTRRRHGSGRGRSHFHLQLLVVFSPRRTERSVLSVRLLRTAVGASLLRVFLPLPFLLVSF